MDIVRLRRETLPDHQRVEGLMPLMHPDLDRNSYRAVLCRLLGIVQAWESTAANQLPERLLSLASERARADLLRQDLQALGGNGSDVPQPELPRFASLSEVLGAMYVMEGSRLGGQFIARHVQAHLDLDSGVGLLYFEGFADNTGPRWREFLATLDAEVANDQTDDAIRGAKKMFAAFEHRVTGLNQPKGCPN